MGQAEQKGRAGRAGGHWVGSGAGSVGSRNGAGSDADSVGSRTGAGSGVDCVGSQNGAAGRELLCSLT